MKTTFADFGLTPPLLKAIQELGFAHPTPVQSQVIPKLLQGKRDLVALAQTGTGKTAAFGLPLLQLTDPARTTTQALILCPTRELCLQITSDFADFGRYAPAIRTVAVYGGASIDTQMRALRRGAQIIVATPGRMQDLLRRRAVRLADVQRVVLDEADEMLNMGFQEDLEAILKEVPDSARTLLFSATMPKQVAAIASKYMDAPEEILIGQRNAGAEQVSHECYVVHARDRYPALRRIIDYYQGLYGIVFCRTRLETQEVADRLKADGYPADALHGELSQPQRDRVMKNFRDRELRILVATDVAARGLDVTDLTHVINYNLPDVANHYTHRSGRTGRAGKTGVSIALVHLHETSRLRYIEQLIKKSFVRKPVPTGREVCEAQLLGLLERIRQLDVTDRQLDPYLPTINRVLGDLPREDLLQRLIRMEFGRFLNDYRNAPDLN
ncbi:MAG: DEAD/DEAH box helicase, partial [Kiritimatiellaeota bacterium]|nr:DEAD/DEAH box helicase [Kiritimatiellota bacterium]